MPTKPHAATLTEVRAALAWLESAHEELSNAPYGVIASTIFDALDAEDDRLMRKLRILELDAIK